jgi:protein-L-isoaspartate(D-aspartate) O-methyltransferase
MKSDMAELVERLIKIGVLKTPGLIEAFLKNDRQNFVPKIYSERTYENNPISIGFGQTISQPSTVAFMMELLQPKSGDKILDVGFGSGWTSGILSVSVGTKGSVLSVEIVPEVYKFGKGNLSKYHYRNIGFFQGSWTELAPDKFDCILVSAAADSTVPQKIASFLKVEGRLVIPVKCFSGQSIRLIYKRSETEFDEYNYPGYIFVPLV